MLLLLRYMLLIGFAYGVDNQRVFVSTVFVTVTLIPLITHLMFTRHLVTNC